MIVYPDLIVRSPDADWNHERWEMLPDDGNRYEVIDGVLYMTTAPSSSHQRIVRQIVLMLYQQIDLSGLGETLFAPLGVFMPGCDPVQPDIFVVSKADQDIIQERGIFGVPALMVEVLSPSNATTDTRTKRTAYARAGVPEYWIVRPASRDVLICSLPNPITSAYAQEETIAADGELVSPTLPVRIAVANLFAGTPDTTL